MIWFRPQRKRFLAKSGRLKAKAKKYLILQPGQTFGFPPLALMQAFAFEQAAGGIINTLLYNKSFGIYIQDGLFK